MTPYNGRIYGTDRLGNYKVRSPQFEKTVILTGSKDQPLKVGDVVQFDNTTAGEYVFFSKNYSLIKPTASEEKSDLEITIDMVLLDEQTGDILVVGTWTNPHFVPYEYHGDICGKNYVLTDKKVMKVNDVESLAKRLGISPDIIYSDRYPGAYRP